MFLIIAVLATLSAAFLLFLLTRRPDTEFLDQKSFSFEPPPNARSLFAPSDSELKIEAAEQKARLIARREYRAKAKNRAVVDKAVADWRSTPDGKHAAELLRVTAERGLDGDFSRAAGEILDVFYGPGVDGLSSGDLAELVDSHIRLLPVSERGSGAIFWLKQEIAKLRPESDVEQR